MTNATEIIRCSQNKSGICDKNEILVVGMEESRRGEWFQKAAAQYACPVRYLDWSRLREQELAPSVFVKVEPPESPGAEVEGLTPFALWYEKELQYLGGLEDVRFLNHPLAIRDTLDKVFSKRRLMEHGIPVTPMIGHPVRDKRQLQTVMKELRITGIFIKHRYGAGAAGIAAYRHHPVTGQSVLYTSMRREEDGKYYNTKKLFRLSDSLEIDLILEFLLAQPVILERWVQKDKYQGVGYDIRAVYQFGRLDFMVARGSKGPMTNLHLNNHAITMEELNLPDSTIYSIEDICRRSVQAFSGLSIAGLDILVSPLRQLKVIEINGQGDLIYQDIFHENRIYKRQIEEGIKRYGRDDRT